MRQAIQLCRVQAAAGNVLIVTASFGISWIEERIEDINGAETALLKQADESLYQAKERGRNRIECSDEPQTASI